MQSFIGLQLYWSTVSCPLSVSYPSPLLSGLGVKGSDMDITVLLNLDKYEESSVVKMSFFFVDAM